MSVILTIIVLLSKLLIEGVWEGEGEVKEREEEGRKVRRREMKE